MILYIIPSFPRIEVPTVYASAVCSGAFRFGFLEVGMRLPRYAARTVMTREDFLGTFAKKMVVRVNKKRVVLCPSTLPNSIR